MRPFFPLLVCLAAPVFAGDRAPVAYTVVDGAAIPEPLTDAPGDAARGAEAAAAARGGCLACHDGVAAPSPQALAALAPGVLRLSVVDHGVRNPGVGGHAFYDIDPAAGEETVAETRLTAQEVEDLIAWLRAGA